MFLRGEGVCLCPIRVSASERPSRGGKWRLVTRRCVISETALEVPGHGRSRIGSGKEAELRCGDGSSALTRCLQILRITVK